MPNATSPYASAATTSLVSKSELEVVFSAFRPVRAATSLVVMCRLGLKALSRPKPALESRAKPEPW